MEWNRVGNSSDHKSSCGKYYLVAQGFYGDYQPCVVISEEPFRAKHLGEEEFTLEDEKEFCEEYERCG